MCGIAGIIDFSGAKKVPSILHGFSEKLYHRGPDDHGFLTYSSDQGAHCTREIGQLPNGQVGFMHRRLSILDISASGWQPMKHLYKPYYLIFNGEIYNYIELKEQLIKKGARFASQTDTEVLLEAYHQWGIQAIKKFTGMFSFALLDLEKQKIYFARDPFGIKPLYYIQTAHFFAFASEIKALTPLLPTAYLNKKAAQRFLIHDQTDGTSQTLIQSIYRFPASHYAELNLQAPHLSFYSYWAPGYNPSSISFKDAVQTVRFLFQKSINLHLRRDVPLGLALSGGIDSSAVTAVAANLEPRLSCFSFIAGEKTIDESQWIDALTTTFDLPSYKICPTQEELYQDFDHLIYIQDEPFGSTSIMAQYHLYKMIHTRQIKIILEGQGADEILAGYTPFYGSFLCDFLQKGAFFSCIKMMQNIKKTRDFSYITQFQRMLQVIFPTILRYISRNTRYVHGFIRNPSSRDNLTQNSFNHYIESFSKKSSSTIFTRHLHNSLTQTSLPALLRFSDRNSMSFSVESRVPFLTTEFVDYIHSLPSSYLIGPKGETKYIFRQAMRSLVPENILNRQDKIGFAAPEQNWLRYSRPWVEDILTNAYSNLIKIKKLKSDYQKFLTYQRPLGPEFWRALNFLRWQQIYKITS